MSESVQCPVRPLTIADGRGSEASIALSLFSLATQNEHVICLPQQ